MGIKLGCLKTNAIILIFLLFTGMKVLSIINIFLNLPGVPKNTVTDDVKLVAYQGAMIARSLNIRMDWNMYSHISWMRMVSLEADIELQNGSFIHWNDHQLAQLGLNVRADSLLIEEKIRDLIYPSDAPIHQRDFANYIGHRLGGATAKKVTLTLKEEGVPLLQGASVSVPSPRQMKVNFEIQ